MPEKDYYDELKEHALVQGASIFGVADMTGLPERQCSLPQKTLRGLDKAVSVALHLSDRILQDITDGPTKLYFFHYQRVNMLLDQMGLRIMNFIQDRGWDALPIPASQIIDWEKQWAHVSHKHIAARAGIGWIGRNNLLVSSQYGSRQRLITILTNFAMGLRGVRGLHLLLSLPVHQREAGGFRSYRLLSNDEGPGEKGGNQPEHLRAVREGVPGEKITVSDQPSAFS